MRKVLAVLAALVAIPSDTAAHEWYPSDCCSGNDCAPVELIQSAEGGWWMTSKHGKVFVPHTERRRESKDHRMHVCMVPWYFSRGHTGMMVRCVFFPPDV